MVRFGIVPIGPVAIAKMSESHTFHVRFVVMAKLEHDAWNRV